MVFDNVNIASLHLVKATFPFAVTILKLTMKNPHEKTAGRRHKERHENIKPFLC